MLDYYLGRQFPDELSRYTEYFLQEASLSVKSLSHRAGADGAVKMLSAAAQRENVKRDG